MTNSQKVLKSILLKTFIVGAIAGILAGLGQFSDGIIEDIANGIAIFAGACLVVLALTFVAFLVSLVVATSKGE